MIYIVEDDSNISELVVYTLKMAGFDAQSFTCGTELFKQLENNIPELILLDIMLPGEDGICFPAASLWYDGTCFQN